MERKVFFSFHYDRDLWRVNVVRNSARVAGVSAAGFRDQSLWDEAKKRGDQAVKQLIDDGLSDTTVTLVLIGAETATRRYVSYEIEESVARGSGLLGVRINNIKDRDGRADAPGAVPTALVKTGAPIYMWEYGKLGEWVEKAYEAAHPNR